MKASVKKVINSTVKKINYLRTQHSVKNVLKESKSYCDIKPFTAEQKKEIKTYWSKLGKADTSYAAFAASLNGKYSKMYIPDDFWYGIIMPAMNNFKITHAWSDKNLYNRLFSGVKMPKVHIKNMNGLFYDSDNKVVEAMSDVDKIWSKLQKVIIKPSLDTGGGRLVQIIDASTDADMAKVLKIYKSDFLVQDIVDQHPVLKDFNTTSLNTIRLISYRTLANEFVCLSSVLRIGRKGKCIDNRCAGGIFCGINNGGELSEYAYSLPYCEVLSHSDEGVSFNKTIIPSYKNAVDTALSLHRQIPYCRIVAWDLCVNVMNEVELIECNLECPELVMMQIANGPLFGKYTDEIFTVVKSGSI